ncbi:MotE family protein [Gluconacetobacter sp. Hr-1-5]|uniref:MotE family protein n=1 Tax=Gluconacetobacter sp. Hr-1-5 TaxID=3395370 RepID=UPI003B515D92
MTLLLAMNMHALAGHLKDDTIEADDTTTQTPAPQKDQSRPAENTERTVNTAKNATEGWTSILYSDEHDVAKRATDPAVPAATATPTPRSAELCLDENCPPVVSTATAVKSRQSADPEVAKAEADLVQNILTRQSTFDDEQKNLEEQKHILDAAQAALNEKMRTLDSSMAALAERQAAHRETMSAETDRLVRIYEEMPPKEAAAVFNIMDIHVLVSVANKMSPRKISAVMGYMMPERVNIVSQYMAGVRTFRPLRTSLDGMAGQPVDSAALAWPPKSRADQRQSEQGALKLSRQ